VTLAAVVRWWEDYLRDPSSQIVPADMLSLLGQLKSDPEFRLPERVDRVVAEYEGMRNVPHYRGFYERLVWMREGKG
jgi:hypothetical protein